MAITPRFKALAQVGVLSRPLRGRPEESEKRGGIKQDAAARRRNRMETPPTWRSAFNRALIATAVFAVFVILFFDKGVTQAVILAPMLLLLYVPLTYYTDLWLHKRWLRKNRPEAA